MDHSFWLNAMNLGLSIVDTEGLQVMISNYKCITFVEDFFHSKQCKPDEMIMRHLIWVYTVCQSTHLGITNI